MPDNTRTLPALQALFPDNPNHEITAQRLRDFLVSAYQPQSWNPGGRLTTESGVPVSTTDRTAQSVLYYTPFLHDRLGLYDGSGWALQPFPEFALPLSGLTDAKNYDVFPFFTAAAPSANDAGTDTLTFGSAQGWATGSAVTCDATGGGLTAGTYYWYRAVTPTTGTLHTTLAGALADTGKVDLTASIAAALSGRSLELSAAWTNDTTRADALATQNGVYVKGGAATRRYVGTVRATGTTTTEDSEGGTSSQVGGRRFVWNLYNQEERPLTVIDTADTWSYNTNTIRQANAAGGNRVEYVVGLQGKAVKASVRGVCYNDTGVTHAARVGVGVDSTTAFASRALVPTGANLSATGNYINMAGEYSGYPGIGYHALNWLEAGSSGTCTFIGDNGGSGAQSGLKAEVWG